MEVSKLWEACRVAALLVGCRVGAVPWVQLQRGYAGMATQWGCRLTLPHCLQSGTVIDRSVVEEARHPIRTGAGDCAPPATPPQNPSALAPCNAHLSISPFLYWQVGRWRARD